jgi:hypothetical protein
MGWWRDLGRESRVFVVVVFCWLLLLTAAAVLLALRVASPPPSQAGPASPEGVEATLQAVVALVATQAGAAAASPTCTPGTAADVGQIRELLREDVRREVVVALTAAAAELALAPTHTAAPAKLPQEQTPPAAASPEASPTARPQPTPLATGQPEATPQATSGPGPSQPTAAPQAPQGPLPDPAVYWVRYWYFPGGKEGWQVGFALTVVNCGRTAAQGFWAALYVERTSGEPVAALRWRVPSLAAGGALTLTAEEAEGGPVKLALPSGHYRISAAVNVLPAGEQPIPEASVQNNSLGPFRMEIGTRR